MKTRNQDRFAAALFIAALAGLSAVSIAVRPVCAQEVPGAVQASQSENQERLDKVHEMVETLKKYGDSTIQASIPTITLSLERWATSPEDTTEADLEIYRAVSKACFELSQGSRSFDPLGGSAALDNVKKAISPPPAASRPVISSGDRRVPGRAKAGGSGHIGVVTLTASGQEKIIAEVPNAAGGMSAAQRARKIAQRIQAAAAADPLWYLNARPGVVHGDSVVKVDRAPDGYILTADMEFARLRQIAPDKLAERISRDIRMTASKPSALAASRAIVDSPDDRQADAVECRVKGDEAYSKGDKAGAEREYLAGLKANSRYALLYSRLANLYDEEGKRAQRSQIVKEGLALPHIDEAIRSELSALK